MQIEDNDILNLFEINEQKAFSSLVMKYQERIYWHVRKMVLNHEDANDITQNIFIKVWKGLSKFKKESNLFTWIYRIATNETLNFIKSNKNKIAQSIENIQIENRKDDSFFSGDEIEAKLHLAITTLPEKQKLVFNMKYFDDLKYTEIVAIIGGTVGSLKASYHHAQKKIEKYLTTN
ncbi:sigma-70 family RNA polymerase sigma factor [bacterium]|nr:sigma-70 family RNA polymerase sigma factor [bacterium]